MEPSEWSRGQLRKDGITVNETDLRDASAPHHEASRWDAMDFTGESETHDCIVGFYKSSRWDGRQKIPLSP
jgi:hypothetical protein